MNSQEILDKILLKYSATFDLMNNFKLNDHYYSAYGYYSSSDEKYVLSRKANLWTTNTFEYALFLEVEKLNKINFDQIEKDIYTYMEPVMVRRGKKYPEKDHMYSYMTVVIISNEMVEKDVIDRINKFKFERSYLFDFRGRSQTNIVCVSVKDENVYTNKSGKYLRNMFNKILLEGEEATAVYA